MLLKQIRAVSLLFLLTILALLCRGSAHSNPPGKAEKDVTKANSETKSQSKPPPADEHTIRDLIEQLRDDSFPKRQAASKRLIALGEQALPLLRRAARDDIDPDVRLRAGRAAYEIEKALFGEVRSFKGHTGQNQHWVNRLAVTPDGKQAVSVGFDACRSWNLQTGKQLRVFGQQPGGYWAVTISPDGKRLFTSGSGNNTARLYDLSNYKELKQFNGHNGAIWGAAFLKDGKHIVTGSWDATIRVWELATGKQVRTFKKVQGSVRCLALSPDGKYVAAGHFTNTGGGGNQGPGTLRLWDVAKGEEIRAFNGHTAPITSVAFSPDGKKILTSSFDRTLRLWDTEKGKELKRFEGHTDGIEAAAFTPDGNRILSCAVGKDPTIRIWDAKTGKLLLVSEPVEEGFLCVAVLPDGHQCVTGGKDGVVRLWRWTR